MLLLPELLAGLRASTRGLLDFVLATAESRLNLLAKDLETEKCQFVETILCALAVAALGVITLSLVTFTLLLIFWETARLASLVCLSTVYLCGTVLAWR